MGLIITNAPGSVTGHLSPFTIEMTVPLPPLTGAGTGFNWSLRSSTTRIQSPIFYIPSSLPSKWLWFWSGRCC